MSYGDTLLFINNVWRESRDGKTLPVLNPASGQEIGRVAHAGLGDLDECNGRTGVTPEFPKGIYHYYATDTFPHLQRCVKGKM